MLHVSQRVELALSAQNDPQRSNIIKTVVVKQPDVKPARLQVERFQLVNLQIREREIRIYKLCPLYELGFAHILEDNALVLDAPRIQVPLDCNGDLKEGEVPLSAHLGV